jgi:membrane-bound metal-dependent hydrolase YbcI (DUF457 family)
MEKAAAVRRGPGKFADLLDYRLVFLGSVLPDLIDKPLGGLVFREALGSGRIYSHTLLFLLALLGAGLLFWSKYRKPWFLILAGGVFFHHVLDGMWLYPSTLLWPAYGWAFPKVPPEGWWLMWMKNLSTNPGAYLPEIFGLVILISFGIELQYRKKLRRFITTGRIS